MLQIIHRGKDCNKKTFRVTTEYILLHCHDILVTSKGAAKQLRLLIVEYLLCNLSISCLDFGP